MTWLYLLLVLGSVSVPLAFSFENRVSFYRKWPSLIAGLLITTAVFIIWDIWFTDLGIWKFNPDYVLGIYWWNLPMEEWLFFIGIPYACVFIHEALKYYIPKTPLDNKSKQIGFALIGFSLIMVLLFHDRLYTMITFSLLVVMLLINLFVLKSSFLGRFFFSYLVTLIPFALVNGVLTAMPVLIYNDAQNCGFRLGTIPFEDCFYSMLMLLMNITVFEHLHHKLNSLPN